MRTWYRPSQSIPSGETITTSWALVIAGLEVNLLGKISMSSKDHPWRKHTLSTCRSKSVLRWNFFVHGVLPFLAVHG